MTAEERDELSFLRIVIENNIKRINETNPNKELKDEFGLMVNSVLSRMQYIRVIEYEQNGYNVLPFAERRYKEAKSKIFWQPIKRIAFWITFIAAVISAVLAYLTYVKTFHESSPKSATKTLPKPTQSQPQPPIPKQPDTTTAAPHKMTDSAK